MGEAFYWAASIVAIGSGVGVVVARNAVHSAIYLVVVMVSLGVIYIGSGAEFIGMVQVIVYAGAIMVLFLFVIMLLRVEGGGSRGSGNRVIGKAVGVVMGLVFMGIMVAGIVERAVGEGVMVGVVERGISNTKEIGGALFGKYVLPFEVASILLLGGIIGVMVMNRKGGGKKGW